MFNSIKKSISSFFTGATLLRDSENPCLVPKVYLSDARYAQDLRNMEDWQNLGIGLILNVTSEDPADEEIQQIYKDLGIQYLWVPIRDTYENIPFGYLSNIVDYVESWATISTSDASSINTTSNFATTNNLEDLWMCSCDTTNPNILIHCSAGVNRSALVAAAILWYTTPNRVEIWPTPDILIDYMRQRQLEDRGTYLLSNASFYNYLMEFLH